ncbi:hypothetical protein WOLCODRAFT_135950 [Wolfiporia cocos MD-104 SS10]|uniref:Nuclear rim protein 1 n=1 Tax=Wolfiporia cocos (strain MD-104) TaxID=742152 RepID=A0A2H3J6R8_WOLCO|nr:hypothetical protein WOLCODRAFT_135950 [Wolfiporia cocos MD-104 SS10]
MSTRRATRQNSPGTPTPAPRPRRSAGTQATTAATATVPRDAPTALRGSVPYYTSPVLTESKSASVPFDWEAVRSRRPPPYGVSTPKRSRGVRQSDIGTPVHASPGWGTPGTRRERAVRKKSFLERIKALPSEIAFELSLFPDNIPRPAPDTSAWILGGFAHFVHLCVRIARIRQIPDSDLGWEDMYREGEDEPWFDWTVPATALLFGFAILNALYYFTRTKLYQLTMATEPVPSPHAAFVSRPHNARKDSDEDVPGPSGRVWPLIQSMLSRLWRAFVVSVRFLLNLSPPTSRRATLHGGSGNEKIQQLEVWTPGELEGRLFSIYSPVHALLWTAVTSASWMHMCCIMAVVGVQLRALTRAYEALLKDRAIIAAEVLHEYNAKFVNPRVNPIRKDVAVMTHQAEVVDYWTAA